MITQIEGNINKNVFAPIQSDGVKYAIAKPINKKQDQEQKKIKDREADKNASKLGIRIAEIALLSSFIVLVALKGAPKKWHSKLDQVNKNLVDSSSKLKNKFLSLNINQKLQNLTSSAKAIFNLAPLKDVLISRALDKSPALKKVGNYLTDLFEKISVKTSKRSYTKTMGHLDTLFANFAQANKKLPKEEAKLIEEKIAKIRNLYSESFSETARNERLTSVKSHFDGYNDNGEFNPKESLKQRVWADTYEDLNKFFKNNTYLTFISEELAAKEKMRVYNEVFAKKIQISNSLQDICNATYKLFMHLDTFVEPSEIETRQLFKKVINTLKKYEKAAADKSMSGEQKRVILMNSKIPVYLQQIDEIFRTSKKYDIKTKQMASENIKQLVQIYQTNQRGEIQDIIGIYKRNLSRNDNKLTEKDYESLKKQSAKAINSFNNSTTIETDKLFDKIRDLKIGSAPKDTLGVLASVGIVGLQLQHADNKDERVSVTIKYGIPTVGAVLIALYCTVGLISAGPSLLIGVASGLALNRVGEVADDLRKKYFNSTISFQNIALPESVQTIRRNLDKKANNNSKSRND